MKINGLIALFLMLALPAGVARAGDYEITPLAGYTVGGQFERADSSATVDLSEHANYGVILGLRDRSRTDEAYYELLYSRQETDFTTDGTTFSGDSRFQVDISYIHLGGRYGRTGNPVNPFIAGGIGATHFSPERGDDETRASFSLGGGVLVPLGAHVRVRFEGRGFGTLFNSRGELFCVDGRCAVHVASDLFWQFSGFAGITLSF